MSFFKSRNSMLGLLLITGLVVALLSVLESWVPAISAFCGMLGDGCQETAHYRLLGLSIAVWGLLYYGFLGLLFLRLRSGLFWAVMAGCGAEFVLVKTMLEAGFFCIFCAANVLLMCLLFLSLFSRKRAGSMGVVLLLIFILVEALISGGPIPENRPLAPDAVLARVGDRTISVADVERPLISEIHKLQQKIYEMKRAVLESQITDLLLEQEAQKHGLTLEAWVAQLRQQFPVPSAQIIDHYYASKLYRQWGAVEGSEQEIKDNIKEYLQIRDQKALIEERAQQLKTTYPVTVFLTAPPLPLTQIRIEGAPTLGPASAPVVVVEFSDYHCSACRKGHGVVQRIKAKYQGQIRWVFKDYPLKRHPGAFEMALAARGAQEQGQFWAYQERLFSAAKKPSRKEALAYADELGLNLAQFRENMVDPNVKKALENDRAQSRAAGISTTPSFLINEKLRPGMPTFAEFSERIDRALKEAQSRDP